MTKKIKQKDDWSLDKLSIELKNPSPDVFVSVYTKKKVEVKPVSHPDDKLTLAKLAAMIVDLKNDMNAGFKQVNERIDNIEKRLDYNGLKPLPDRK